MCLALHYCLSSLASPSGGEGRGEEATSPGQARPPPSPTLPPLVPRGERETCVEYAKHILRMQPRSFSCGPAALWAVPSVSTLPASLATFLVALYLAVALAP